MSYGTAGQQLKISMWRENVVLYIQASLLVLLVLLMVNRRGFKYLCVQLSKCAFHESLIKSH